MPLRSHAQRSQQQATAGRPGSAAATLVLARAEAARGNVADAAALGLTVLGSIPALALRDTARSRLRELNDDVFAIADPGPECRDLRERLRDLPPLLPAGRISDEPNGL